MLEGAGQGNEAEAVLRKALQRLPDEPRLHEELGRLLVRLGRTQEAAASLRQSLRLRPQQPALRRYAESLARLPMGPTVRLASRILVRTFAADGADVEPGGVACAAWLRRMADPAVVLLDRHVTRVHANGLADTFVQRIVHLRTDRGARDNQEVLVRYLPGEQEVENPRGAHLSAAPPRARSRFPR